MALLRVIAGADVGKTTDVLEVPVAIGRGDDCGLCLTDRHVSMIHALVEPVSTGFRLRDLETTNGTSINGQAITEQPLAFGDRITVGETVILFGSGEETVETGSVGRAEAPSPGDNPA